MTRHGTRHGYRDDRCKCDACKKAIALEHNVYKMRRAANGGDPLTVNKVGAVRRLQALMALGWPRRELARRAGYQGDAFALILNGKRQRLTLDTHRRIVALYDELSMTLGPSNPSRLIAERRGWPKPLAWDDDTIDDPKARPRRGSSRVPKTDVDPIVVERLLAGQRVESTKGERDEAMRLWLSWGRSEKSLCAIHGWHDGRYGRLEAAS
jgi:hypothetical protein